MLPATPEIYTLSLHDALPISTLRSHACVDSDSGESSLHGQTRPHGRTCRGRRSCVQATPLNRPEQGPPSDEFNGVRSEEHTSELQSHHDLVCRLLLEKKNTRN